MLTKMMNALETYTAEVVEKLSGKYGFDAAEALTYVKEETAVSRGRPEKKSKKVVNKGEMVEAQIETILTTEVVVAAPAKKKATPKKKAEAVAEPVVEAVAEAVVEAVAEAVVEAVAEPVVATPTKKKAVPKKKAEAVVEAVAEPVVEAVAEPVVATPTKKKATPKKKAEPVEEEAPQAKKKAAPKKKAEPVVVVAEPLVEDVLTEESDDDEVETEEWTDTDGTVYLLVPAANNLVLTSDDEHTEVGYLVDGCLVRKE